jgi:HlyD family secretion protein
MGYAVKRSYATILARRAWTGAALASMAVAACSGPQSEAASRAPAAGDSTAAATPVRTTAVRRGNLDVVVSGPGRTDALDVQQVRAPFTGALSSLEVVIGDRVEGGQVIGTVEAQASQAALTGAEAMLRSAGTPAERSDAERALELAKQNLVRTQLHAPRAGVVVSRAASEGDLLTQGDSIVSIASARSVVFVARIAQSDLDRIRAGQAATIDLPARSAPLQGTVHGLLPADTSAMSVPVRLDIGTAGAPITVGLFGTAHITVGRHTGVPIVPTAAILRDDVSGVARVATVTPAHRVHWVGVSIGVQQGNDVEIVTPALAPGQRVIVSGQVGLPEASNVRETSAP